MEVEPMVKASWTPPGFVFGIVWTVAFWQLARAYQKMDQWPRWLHFCMLHAWTPVFFGLHMYRTSVFLFGGIYILSAFLAIDPIWHAIRYRQRSAIKPAVLWALFMTWLTFAASLNIYAAYAAHKHDIPEGMNLSGTPTRLAAFFGSH